MVSALGWSGFDWHGRTNPLELDFVGLPAGCHESSHAVLGFLGSDGLVEEVGFLEKSIRNRQFRGMNRGFRQSDGGRGK